MNIWEFIYNQLENKQKVILMIVIESRGSSPGRQGFKMAVSENSKMEGSIGGGIMEYQMVELAKKMFKKPFQPFIKRQNHNKKAEKDQSGMICSGHQVITFYALNWDKITKNMIADIVDCLNANCKQTLSVLPNRIFLSEQKQTTQYKSKITDENNWEYHEIISYKNEMYIIGGGHVGLALSEIMRFLDFYIHVIDDRENLNTMKQNRFAHRKHHLDYSKIADFIPEGNNIYVVIMTHKHLSDKEALKNLIRKNVKYLGFMGSKTKVRKIFEQLQNEGFSKEELKKIYSPIGIDIKSETPQEIAVSIAAEIIKIKNKG
jgi:xanthine dehydrogenase accessory factor